MAYTVDAVYNEIVPGLFITNWHGAQKAREHKLHHIKTIINISGFSYTRPAGLLEYIEIPEVEDRNSTHIEKHFPTTSFIIHEGLKRGGVVVHCWAGVSRATTIVAAYLIRYHKMSNFEALALIQQRRPITCANCGFKKRLKMYYHERIKSRQAAKEREDALAALDPTADT